MKILYLHPRAWTGEYVLLKALQRLGHELGLLEEIKRNERRLPGVSDAFLEPGDRMETLWYRPTSGMAKLLTWPLDRFFKRSFDGRNLGHQMWCIHAAYRHFKPDVLLAAEGFSYGIPAAFLRRLRLIRAPLVINYIGGDILDHPEADVGKRRKPRTRFLIRQGISSADILRPFSPLLRSLLITEGGDPKKIRVIPGHMASDPARIRDIAARRAEVRQRLCARYAIDPASPIIATLTTNLKGKGLHVLAEAWPKVLTTIPGARWLLCGSETDWLKERVLPALARADALHTVVLTGHLATDSVFEHLACANLCVLPTLADGGPMSNIEAAAVGTPVLTTDRAGNSTWLKEAGCGEYVPAGDAEALASALVGLLSNLPRLSRMGQAGPALADRFTADAVARQLSALLDAARLDHARAA